ncbi:hypothetical protein IX38_18565 [Chryseobacterium luteum]|uniref:Tail fiber domain-containing protein n=2 Tax=Chryseobacterium luteum TaxID=421531 RepID=A0A085Z3M8_9FLAO|nr:hypothetical protein IX38_18565 [Chryseobacterium luteum]
MTEFNKTLSKAIIKPTISLPTNNNVQGMLFYESQQNKPYYYNGSSWISIDKTISPVQSITTVNATDINTAINLVNELKEKINELLTNLDNGGVMD